MTFMPYWHPSFGPPDAPVFGAGAHGAGPADDLLTGEPDPEFDRADCCNARAQYRVELPVASGAWGTKGTEGAQGAQGTSGSASRDLVLCGHHLRASRDALAARGAAIFDEQGRIADGRF